MDWIFLSYFFANENEVKWAHTCGSSIEFNKRTRAHIHIPQIQSCIYSNSVRDATKPMPHPQIFEHLQMFGPRCEAY